MRTADLVLRRLRKLCLSLPESSEVGSWGHPNFRAGKRTFVAFEWIDGRPSIAFRLNATDIDLLLRRRRFFVTPYGRGQWVSVWADGPLNWSLVEHLLQRSYRMVALKRMIKAFANTSKKSMRKTANIAAADRRNETGD
jgi:predicted DNA-binding protein (MmcQ/YjbR family)